MTQTFQEEAREFVRQNHENIEYFSKFGSLLEKAVAKTLTDASRGE
jgi:DNA-directed RNA polymerase subunit F